MGRKIESTLINMILSLVLISMTMSAALGFVYLKTKEPIEIASRQKEIQAIRQVIPEFDSDPLANMSEYNGVIVYQVSKQNKPAGFAIKSFTEKGFAGHIEIMAGFLPDGTVNNVVVLNHKETPGLGTKMTDPKFSDQFEGKNPSTFSLKVKKDGGDVDAITAATVSSRAYCDALQRAFETLKSINDSLSAQL
ncbi:MAG TPA: RnfABCDGE type electron transport complex subunit G [Bacteroidales bacterium]|nr:RnfABCDGE type electron transport complex subunit G [Bacteroidales bacterium]